MNKKQAFFTGIQAWTEKRLTERKIRQEKAKEKAKKKGPVRDWIEALLWAVVFVFLINQFIFQLYQIPTPSMEDTLLVKDRVFVNKFIFGPELYPGGPKILSFFNPKRNDIIVFENPNYISRGPVFDVANRIVYMITLSLVNLDKDENGEPRAQLYVKRAVGASGDILTFEQGNLYLQPEGFREKIDEFSFRELAGYSQPTKRQIPESSYAYFSQQAAIQAYSSEGLDIPDFLSSEATASSSRFTDYYYLYQTFYETKRKIDPSDSDLRSLAARYKLGYYIPEHYVMPLGDNRDNSSDGRYFGPVPFDTILGKTIFRFWPIGRIGFAR